MGGKGSTGHCQKRDVANQEGSVVGEPHTAHHTDLGRYMAGKAVYTPGLEAPRRAWRDGAGGLGFLWVNRS